MQKKGIGRLSTFIVGLIFLTVCLALDGLNASAAEIIHKPTINGQYRGYSYIWFGSYPMDEVFDTEIIQSIDNALGDNNIGDCEIAGENTVNVTFMKANLRNCGQNSEPRRNHTDTLNLCQ